MADISNLKPEHLEEAVRTLTEHVKACEKLFAREGLMRNLTPAEQKAIARHKRIISDRKAKAVARKKYERL